MRQFRFSWSWSSAVLLSLLALSLPPQVAAEGQAGVPVGIALVQERAIERVVQLTGTVTSARAARLSAATSGLVAKLHVDAGSKVVTGDVLLELDPELAQLQWQSARAVAEQARNALADARRRLQEARTLAPQRSIAETVVRDLAAEVAEDEAALHEAEALAAYREGVLSRHQLKAPFDGVISLKLTELGEWVTPGQAVLELVATDDVRLDFPVSEDYLADIQPGTPLTFSLSAQALQVYQGMVATVVPVTDPGVRTFLVRVKVDNSDHRMIPGMSVRATLKLAAGRSGLVVPRDATLRFPDGRVTVWVVEAGDDGPVAAQKTIRTGLSFDGQVEVQQGLEAGARVVVRGNEALQSGQRVRIRSGEPN